MKRDELILIYKKILNEVIIKNCVYATGRKQKLTNDAYLNYIMRILFYGENWESFYCIDCCRSTVKKRFYYWTKKNVFSDAYYLLYNRYTLNRTFKRLFIDSTAIQNKNCSDINVTYGALKLKGKKQLKTSIIIDSNRCILSYTNSNPKPFDNKYIQQKNIKF